MKRISNSIGNLSIKTIKKSESPSWVAVVVMAVSGLIGFWLLYGGF